jgi:phosphonate transport system substrate-binding protein
LLQFGDPKREEKGGRTIGHNRRRVSLSRLTIPALLMLGLLLAGCGSDKLGSEDNPIVMSFVPSGEPRESLAAGERMAQMINDRTDLVVQVSAAPTFAAVREAMGKGETHIGWLDTFNYILAHQKHGVEAGLVTERLGATSYSSQFNVRADSGIDSLQALPGRVICWVDASSASGYILPWITLQANGIDPDTAFSQAIQAYSHQNVIRNVFSGRCDVGATYADARGSIADDTPSVEQVVVVLATTPNVPYDSVSFGEDIPEEMREQIVESLLDIAGTEEGRAALEVFYSVTGLQRAGDAIYDRLRSELDQAGVDIEDLAK